MNPLNYLRPVWTVRATHSPSVMQGSDGKAHERRQWLSPGFYWEARKAAEHLNAYYGASDYFSRTHYDVVLWNYFEDFEP